MAVDTLARAIAAGKVPVDAYEMAVAGGYTGTKEQFEADLGNSGTNATNAASSASAAAASATTASNAAANFAPTYSTSATYSVGDYVLYNSGLYECNTAITTAEAWTAAHWTAVKVGPELTDLKNAINYISMPGFQSGFWAAADGTLNPARTDYVCTTLPIPVHENDIVNVENIPLTSGNCYFCQYGPGMTFISNQLRTINSSGFSTYTVLSGVSYIHLDINKGGGTVLNPSDYTQSVKISINGIYLPYSDVAELNGYVDNYLLKGIPNGSLFYTDLGYLYNGSDSVTLDTSAEAGYYFGGFSRVTNSGQAATFAVIKQIADTVRPSVITGSSTLDVWIYFELNSGYDTVSLNRIFFGTNASWNPSTSSFVQYNSTHSVGNGWKKYTLQIGGSGGSGSTYNFAIIQVASYAELAKIKGAYIYTSEPSSYYSEKAGHALSTDELIGFDASGITSAIKYCALDNMITSDNFIDSSSEASIVPNATSKTLSINNYVSTSNAVAFSYTKSASDYRMAFDTSKQYFIAARLIFKNTQTAGSVAAGLFLELTDFNNRVFASHMRLYPSMLIGKTVYAYGILSPTISSGYLRVAFEGMGTSSVNYAFDMDMVFCSEMPENVSVDAMGAVWRSMVNPIDAMKLSGDIETLKNPDYNARLICWGDSLTAGAGGSGVTYPAVCASEFDGISVLNCGVGGENCETIAARQGGNNVVIPAGAINGTYQTLTDIMGNTISPLLQAGGSNSGNALIINGETCTLTYSSGTGYTISGYTGGSTTIPTIARFAGSDFKGDIVTIWIGTNGGNFPGDSTNVDMRIHWINSMIKHIGHDRYVVLGLSVGEETSDFYIGEENKMKQAFGNKYLPTRKYLIESGLTINGLTPTAQDTTDIADGKVPTSLKSDSVHLNGYGYTAVGKLLAMKIRSLGYLT